jgi:hypothetical protein
VGVVLLICSSLSFSCTGLQLSASEREAAEQVALISHNPASRARLQTLLQLDQLDDTVHMRAPILSMLTGEDSGHDGSEREDEGTTSMLNAVKERQGAGFKIAFYPGNSTVYDPTKSKTFKVVPKQMFLLQYADNSALKGFQSRDVVRLGDYSVEVLPHHATQQFRVQGLGCRVSGLGYAHILTQHVDTWRHITNIPLRHNDQDTPPHCHSAKTTHSGQVPLHHRLSLNPKLNPKP